MDVFIEEFKETHSELFAYSRARWSKKTKLEIFSNYKTQFEGNFINEIKTFLKERGQYALDHMKTFFNLENDLVELIIRKVGDGKIQINTIIPDIKDGLWKGKYYCNIPINITAISSEKAKFKEWTGDINSNEGNIIISKPEDTTIEAIFEN